MLNTMLTWLAHVRGTHRWTLHMSYTATSPAVDDLFDSDGMFRFPPKSSDGWIYTVRCPCGARLPDAQVRETVAEVFGIELAI